MKITLEVVMPDGGLCNSLCPFFIEETEEYQQFCGYLAKAFKGKRKLEKCPGRLADLVPAPSVKG